MFGLSTIAIEAIGAAVIALLIFGGGMKLQYDIDAHKLDQVELQYKTAQEKAVAQSAAEQKQIDDQALAAANDEASKQQTLVTTLQQELANVQKHVTSKGVPCISYGLVRVLDAAVLGVSPDSLTLPAGKSDDACSPITADELAVSIIANYGAALGNAEQLNALIALLKKQGMVLKK